LFELVRWLSAGHLLRHYCSISGVFLGAKIVRRVLTAPYAVTLTSGRSVVAQAKLAEIVNEAKGNGSHWARVRPVNLVNDNFEIEALAPRANDYCCRRASANAIPAE
jgi:hypothetical protein